MLRTIYLLRVAREAAYLVEVAAKAEYMFLSLLVCWCELVPLDWLAACSSSATTEFDTIRLFIAAMSDVEIPELPPLVSVTERL